LNFIRKFWLAKSSDELRGRGGPTVGHPGLFLAYAELQLGIF